MPPLPLNDDTIYALATAHGRAGVAVIRISGPQTKNVAEKKLGRLPTPRLAELFHVKHAVTDVLLDKALALWFPAPNSFTGEDCLELHLHGSPAVVQAVYQSLEAIDNVRMAQPGEFTRRAFENGKMDLNQSEALADLIDAETEVQRSQALSNFDGQFSNKIKKWRDDLIRALALTESLVDFPDEDIPDNVSRETFNMLEAIETRIQKQIDTAETGITIRDGYRIAIVGAPNVGKSSLLNQLAKRDAAIVTEQAGTTRDVLEIHINIGGYAVILMDTAGIRETNDIIEKEGIRRAKAAADHAHLTMHVFDANCIAGIDTQKTSELIVINKIDSVSRETSQLKNAVYVSAKTGQGIDNLIRQLSAQVKNRLRNQEQSGITRQRHKLCLQNALGHIQQAKQVDIGTPELMGESLRMACRSLDQVIGNIGVDDILDQIFSSFCIGK